MRKGGYNNYNNGAGGHYQGQGGQYQGQGGQYQGQGGQYQGQGGGQYPSQGYQQGGGGGQFYDGAGGPNPAALLNQIQHLQKTVASLQGQRGGLGGAGGGAPGGYPRGGAAGPGRSMMGGGGTGFDRASKVGQSGGDAKMDETPDPHKGEWRVCVVNNIPIDLAIPQILYEELSNFGEVMRIKICHNKRSTALVQMRNNAQAQKVVDNMSHLNRNGFEIWVTVSTRFTEVPMPTPGTCQDDGLSKDYTGKLKLVGELYWNDMIQQWVPNNGQPPEMFPQQRGGGGGGYGGGYGGDNYGGDDFDGGDRNNGGQGLVLLVSNLPDELSDCDRIFNMLGVYGDVLCIKILRNKRDCALVHMSKPHHSLQVKNNLDQFKVGGKKLTVSYSRVKNLMANKLVEEEGLQKSYVDSRSHRFFNPARSQKIIKNLAPPTNCLHVSNIPEFHTMEDIRDMFAEKGFTVKDMRLIEDKKNMCILEFATPDEAMMALAVMHNYNSEEMEAKLTQKGGSRGLCVSFTKQNGDRWSNK